jgi:hypothetical protein
MAILQNLNLSGVKVAEAQSGREQTNYASGALVSMTVPYVVTGISSSLGTVYYDGLSVPVTAEMAALEAVRRYAPTQFLGLGFDQASIKEKLNESAYLVTVEYVSADSSTSRLGGEDEETDSSGTSSLSSFVNDYSFQSVTSTVHTTMALSRVGMYGAFVHDPGLAIMAYPNGEIAGYDKEIGHVTFSETHSFSVNRFNSNYIATLMTLKDTVNNSSFRGFEKGEVKFDSWQMVRRGSGSEATCEVTFNFSVRKNREAFSMEMATGKMVRVPAQYGWTVIWPYFSQWIEDSEKKDKDGKASRSRVMRWGYTGFVVNQVYEWGNFSKLKLPSGVL